MKSSNGANGKTVNRISTNGTSNGTAEGNGHVKANGQKGARGPEAPPDFTGLRCLCCGHSGSVYLCLMAPDEEGDYLFQCVDCREEYTTATIRERMEVWLSAMAWLGHPLS